MSKPVDFIAAKEFLRLCLSDHAVGIANEEEICQWNSPLVRAHLVAVLGEACPRDISKHAIPNGSLDPLAEYLRGVADFISSKRAGGQDV